MVKPSVTKDASKYLKKKYKASIESICSVFRATRAIWYYASKLDDSEVISKLQEGTRKPLDTAGALNEVWSMDFMSDSFEDGRTLRVLNIIDDIIEKA